MKFLLAVFFCFSPISLGSTYQDGDIIFQVSQSPQSKAIHEASDSRWSHVGILLKEKGRWYVAEAVQPVRMTALSSFISRGKDQYYRVYRLPTLNAAKRSLLREEIGKFLGKSYDIYFEWSDDLIYCSELVYKVFLSAAEVEIGELQKFQDLKLDGPYAKELIRRRLKDTGRTLNLNEPIVTPASQLRDPDLVLIEKTDR